jgi:hypothetical protein
MDFLELIPVGLAAVVVAIRLVMYTPRGRRQQVPAAE